MSAILAAALFAGTPPPLVEAPVVPCDPSVYQDGIIPAGHRILPTPPSGDALGDAWEMEEVACWRGTWLRRGRTEIFDGYWMHPSGERVRATLQMWVDGRAVTVIRRHPRGQYCRYDGTFSGDWRWATGSYTCTWARAPMRWQARIVRTTESLPQVLRP